MDEGAGRCQRRLFIIGHNPGLTDLVNPAGARQLDNLPTAGYVQLALRLTTGVTCGKVVQLWNAACFPSNWTVDETLAETHACSYSLPVLLLLLCWSDAAAPPPSASREAVRFKTISYQDSSRSITGVRAFHQFLRSTYPRVFGSWKWRPSTTTACCCAGPAAMPVCSPILFTAHMDVVPVEPGTEGDWSTQPLTAWWQMAHLRARHAG